MDHELVKSKNLLKGIKVSFKNLTYLKRSEYADYSLQVFGLSLISFMAIQADKLIIAIVLDTSAVTLYTIITKPYVVFKGILAATIPVVQPKLNEYYFNNLSNNFIQLSRKFTRISFFIMLCCTILIGLYYKDLLSIWLKTNIYNSYANWGIISMATLCLTLFYTQFLRTLLHSNKIKYIIYFSIIGVSINVITSTILSYYIGFQGVIIGTTVQIALELIYYKYLERKFISTDKLNLTGYNYLIYIFTIILLSVVCFIMLEYFITTYLLKIVSFIVLLSAFSIVMYMILIKENIVKRATLH
jgi:O-antigen/teichoic acid export membrane protein